MTTYRYGSENFTAEIFHDVGPERERFEEELLNSGVALPLPHRCAWARSTRSARSWFIGTRDGKGKCSCGFAVEVTKSRALPGYLLLRAERFGPALTNEARDVALRALADYTRQHRRILRVSLRVFSRDAEVRNAIARVITGLGFRPQPASHSYTGTVVIDLTPDESEIFSSLHKTARQNIRALSKKGYTVRCITDPVYAKRMDDLTQETMARNKGKYRKQDWAGRIELSNQYPALSRLVGAFQPGIVGPESLVAFVWGCGHGDHAAYTAAASTRAIDSNVSLTYAPVWNLICWAKRNGGSWFDFGGITSEALGHYDPLRGVSDFKRYFSGQVVTVSAEWTLEPHPLPARLANGVASLRRAASPQGIIRKRN